MERIEITSDEIYTRTVQGIYAHGGVEVSAAFADKVELTRWVVDAVRQHGDDAVAECTERFDKVVLTPEEFELSPDEIDAAVAGVDAALKAILVRAYDNIRRFHEKHLRHTWEETHEDGTEMGQRITPIESAGVYVPGGKAFYPSSVLMNIAPARVAGVPEIIMVSPPSWNGSIHPGVLAAARIAGATRIFRVGGAQAVAALAFGTKTIPAVCKITGPGNTFVTAAKGLVRSVVDIDSEAGPSEVVVLADHTANPRYVALELLAQAEHDEEAVCVLITPSAALADRVVECLAQEQATLPRNEIITQALAQHGKMIITRDIEEATTLANLYAPEHLSIQTEFPRRLADRIKNAGAMMLGGMTPVAVGDYYAGPNHILPTRRRARFASPLTAEDFRKVTNIMYYSAERLHEDAEDIMRLAELEGLHAHGRAVEARLQQKR